MVLKFACCLLQFFCYLRINSANHLDRQFYQSDDFIGGTNRYKRTTNAYNCSFNPNTTSDTPERFITPILGGLVPGRIIRIRGYTPKLTQRSNITFQDSAEEYPNVVIPFSISIHFPEKYIEINSFENDTWGAKETKGGLPIKAGTTFEIVILTTVTHYKVVINGNHFCDFPQRIPADRVAYVDISANFQITLLSFEGVPTPSLISPTESVLSTAPSAISIIEGIGPGRLIRIVGFTLNDTDRIYIYLRTDPNKGSDVALHLTIRFREKLLVRHLFENGAWKGEERDGELPISSGQQFELVITCDTSNYKVAFDGKHFCDFPQRISPDRITHLFIGKYMYLSELSFEEDTTSSSVTSWINADGVPSPTEFVAPILEGMQPGQLIRFQGQTLTSATKFTIDLLTASTNLRHDVISLNMDLHLDLGFMARNSLKNGMWGNEEIDGDLPIFPGNKFEITIAADLLEYKIAIDGKHFCNFPQRIGADQVTQLLIYGDVYLTKLSFERDWSFSLNLPKDVDGLLSPRYNIPPTQTVLMAIVGGFPAKKAIRIQGYTLSKAIWFHINLKVGAEPLDDIALRTSFQFQEGNVILGLFRSGWDNQITVNNLTIFPGKKFEIIILSDFPSYKIAVDGKHLYDFPQKISAECVTHLYIEGSVYITQLSLESNQPSASGPSMNPYGKLPPSY